MPGKRDGACEAFDCAYRSPIRREAGVQAFCANAADVRTASAAWTTPMPPRPSSANGSKSVPSSVGRLSASGEADARPAGASSRRQGFSGYREIPTVCSKARSIPNMRRTTHDGRNLVYCLYC